MSLLPQIVIVTGASRGLGYALAQEIGAKGLTVIVAAPAQRDADAAATRLAQTVPLGQFIAAACDVRDAGQVDRLADFAVAQGGAQLWINNAGLALTGRTLAQLDSKELAAMVEVNLLGVMHGCRSAARIMTERGGLIVNVHGAGSDGKPVPGMIGYATTKRAVQFFTTAFAAELAHSRIKVIGISPGLVLTEGFFREHAKIDAQAVAAREAVVNILADPAPVVAKWAVRKMLENPANGREHRWLTAAKIRQRKLQVPARDVLSPHRLALAALQDRPGHEAYHVPDV